MTTKNRIKTISCITILIFLFITSIIFTKINNKEVFAQNKQNVGTSEIIMEVNSNRILFSNNINVRKYMASTTKILTAIVVIENCNIDEEITITKKTTGIEGSSIYLEEGEKMSIRHLLYGLMLRSGNDCAETLAVHLSGSIEEFASLMNQTALKIGAKDSNFVNPHGLHDDNHYTTAYDLALISCYAMKNPTFREIVSTKKIEIPFSTRNYPRILFNKNKMLNTFEGSNGVKTGYTKKAGRCLVSSCVRNGMELVCVVLNCPPMWERSKDLLTNTFENYSNYLLVESDNIIDFIEYKNKKLPLIIQKDIVLPLTKDEYNNIKIEYDYQENINEILDRHCGNIKIYCYNNLIFSEKLYIIE